jgi:mRNA interferase MazF
MTKRRLRVPVAKRGEIWQVDLGLAAKVRPALVLSIPFLDHERALYAIVPHTTAPRGTRFEVQARIPRLDDGVFDVQGIRSVPPSVLVQHRATLTQEQLSLVEAMAKQWLGLK